MSNLSFRPAYTLSLCASLFLLHHAPTVQAQIFPELTLEHVADTAAVAPYSRPVTIRHASDGSGRLFIARQSGDILIYDSSTDSVLPTPFLDISALVDDSGNEQGLLGLDFHPGYATNGYFYVNYTRDPGPGFDRTVIARYTVSANPNIADPSSASVLLEIAQDSSNHNGGDIHFGPDGYLYIGMGDGGGSGDPNNNAQDLNTLLGKILRIDVDAATPASPNGLCGLNPSGYGIPGGNPYEGADGGCAGGATYCECDEIWVFGMRNPWRWSFDYDTGDMFIGDVGQGSWEEVDFLAAGGSGLNFGWRCREGAHPYSSYGNDCGPLSGLTEPILEYAQGGSPCNSVTGGYRYRGKYLPFNGTYIYGEYCQGNIWFANNTGGAWSSEEWMDTAFFITTFGEDEQQEIYLAESGGDIYRIKTPECPSRTCPEGFTGWKFAIPPAIGP